MVQSINFGPSDCDNYSRLDEYCYSRLVLTAAAASTTGGRTTAGTPTGPATGRCTTHGSPRARATGPGTTTATVGRNEPSIDAQHDDVPREILLNCDMEICGYCMVAILMNGRPTNCAPCLDSPLGLRRIKRCLRAHKHRTEPLLREVYR